jgi:hypothetical protein
MKRDSTRDTFDRCKHYTRVLMQQGRVQLDADWNEQAAILLHYLQALAADLIGPYAGLGDGFKIEQRLNQDGNPIQNDFLIKAGHYYVHGILCENEWPCAYYTEQPDYPVPDTEKLEANKTYLIYLDVWERHITHIEDDSIREVALGGPDTATRAKVVWQVKTQPVESGTDCSDIQSDWNVRAQQWQAEHRGLLEARAKIPEDIALTDPCITPPEAHFRGAENQLYRVEIHGGTAEEEATLKWSRENGSVIFPIRRLQGKVVTLEHLGRGKRFGLEVGDWVEIADDDSVLQGRADRLLQVDAIEPVDMTVTLKLPEGADLPVYDEQSTKHPLLRRWDHKAGSRRTEGEPELANDGALLVKENDWLTLEDGVQIWFQSVSPEEENRDERHIYRTGDYWLIPARTATGDVEWPGPPEAPEAIPPHGIVHHYAPLAVISLNASGVVTEIADCRIPRTIVVDCNADVRKTLGEALEKAKPGDTIRVRGTCVDTVTIVTDRLTLEGVPDEEGRGATIEGVSIEGVKRTVITIEGARGVTIRNLTVQGGLNGICARRGTTVTLEGVTADGNDEDGFAIVENSTAQISNCTARDNGDDGFTVARASSATFTGTITSEGNADDGLSILLSSSGNFFEATVMANNNGRSETFDAFIIGDGIRVTDASHLIVTNSTVNVRGNANDGIAVARTSTFAAFAGADDGPVEIFVEENGQLSGEVPEGEPGDGVQVREVSSFTASGSKTMLTVRKNARYGFNVSDSSDTNFFGAHVSSEDNAQGDVGVTLG